MAVGNTQKYKNNQSGKGSKGIPSSNPRQTQSSGARKSNDGGGGSSDKFDSRGYRSRYKT